jgi:hypothetical protein
MYVCVCVCVYRLQIKWSFKKEKLILGILQKEHLQFRYGRYGYHQVLISSVWYVCSGYVNNHNVL